MGTTTVTGCYGKRYTLNTEGNIDRHAENAFSRGQCHALALALHRLMGWELYGLYTASERRSRRYNGTPSHTVVRMPDGDYLDIHGNGALDNWRVSWPDAEPIALTEAEVLAFEHRDYRKPNIKAAMPYAETLAGNYSRGGVQTRFPFAI
jgi:hypothetical protein